MIQWSFLEDGNAQNLQKRVERNLQSEFLLDDRGQDIDCDGRPDLRLDRIFRYAEKRLDPSKEQLDLPSEFIKLSDRQRWKSEIIRQKDKIAIVVPIIKADATKLIREAIVGIEAGQGDRLIGSDIGNLLHRGRSKPMATVVRLVMKSKEPAVINVTAIQDIKATGFEKEFVQNPHVMHFSIGNMDKRRNLASQIKKRMNLDGAFILAEHGPWKKRQAKIDRSRIESIDSVVQFQAEILVGIKRTGLADKNARKIGINPPIASFIGEGQGVKGNPATETHVIKTIFHGPGAGLDVAKTLAKSHLSKGQAEELIVTRKSLDLVVSPISSNACSEFVEGKESHHLRKHGRRGIHQSLLAEKSNDNTKPHSNRLQSNPGLSYV